MKTHPIVFPNPPVALPVTEAQLIALGFTPEQIAAGEARGEMRTFGPWSIPLSFRALCVSSRFNRGGYFTEIEETTVFGMRTLSKARQSGYELEGRVSVNGRTVRGFTSSQMFELPDGRLFNTSTIHACLDD